MSNELIIMPVLIFSCGGLEGKDQKEIERLIDDDDLRSVTKPRFFGVGKDIDPTLIPHDLGERARTPAPVEITELGVKWLGGPLKPGSRLGFVEGELGEEGVFLDHYNTLVGKDGWYWKCKEDKNYNIIVSSKGSIICTKNISAGDYLIRK